MLLLSRLQDNKTVVKMEEKIHQKIESRPSKFVKPIILLARLEKKELEASE